MLRYSLLPVAAVAALLGHSGVSPAANVTVKKVTVEACAKATLKVADGEACFVGNVRNLGTNKWEIDLYAGVEVDGKIVKFKVGDFKFKVSATVVVEDAKNEDDAVKALAESLPQAMRKGGNMKEFAKASEKNKEPDKVSKAKIVKDKTCAELIRDLGR